jgi:flagellar biosynthesis protein FlhG
MNWTDTRKKLLQLASGRPPRPTGPTLHGPVSRAAGEPGDEPGEPVQPAPGPSADPRARAVSLCIASGKGGTGKSIVTAALGALFAPRGRTLIVDGDFGVGNAHILQDLSPRATCVDVVEGRVSVRDALVSCGKDLDLLAAGSGVPRMADLSGYELHLLASGLCEVETDYRTLLVDSAAGVSQQTVSFARAADVTLIVTTPDLTAMTDAYAFLKLLFAGRPGTRALLLVNRAANAEEAEEVTRRIARVGERFLGSAPRCIGWLPHDPAVSSCVNRRGSVVSLEPAAGVSRALRLTAAALAEELARLPSKGFGRELQREIGYSARPA